MSTSSEAKTTAKILVVDDDPALRQLLAEYLNRSGFDTLVAPDATDLQQRIARFNPALIVLDRMMPGVDGMQACKQMRERGEDIPVIMLTARDEATDRVLGLQSGADDYLGKPFDPRELVARIEAVLRRKSGPSSLNLKDKPVRFGEFSFDPRAHILTRNGEQIKLTGGEFALLGALLQTPGKPIKRERLLELSRPEGNESLDRAVDVAVLRLRRALGDDPKNPQWIRTVWGVGYVFAGQVQLD